MGLLARVSTVTGPGRMRATASVDPFAGMYQGYVPPMWLGALSAAGVSVTPEGALALSAFYAGVTMIGRDLATLPWLTFKRREDEGKDRVRPFFGEGIDTSGGISSLAYMLRWQPNYIQTAAEFWFSMLAQYEMRDIAYAEIISGSNGFLEQLLPRHPDRVTAERLPSGRLRYRLREANGRSRYVTHDEMFVIRGLSFDGGVSTFGRVQAGTQSIGLALATQGAASRFFKSGMTAAMLATYAGEKDEGYEGELHTSISRFAAGVENSFGLMLVPDNVQVKNLGIEPEKAQMMLAQEWGVREVARLLHMPGSKLGIKDSVGYNSQVQDAVNYAVGCLRPIAVFFEQAVQRDLILRKDTFFMEILIDALFRGDPDARAAYYEKAIRNRWMRPSEVRLRENLNPDLELDRLSERDFQPGGNGNGGASDPQRDQSRAAGLRPSMKAWFAIRDNAVRVLRRERAAVAKLADKHANDVPGWKASLRDFYGEHAHFVAQVMRLSIDRARDYAAQHGTELEAKGIVWMDEHWERDEADELATLAIDGERRAA